MFTLIITHAHHVIYSCSTIERYLKLKLFKYFKTLKINISAYQRTLSFIRKEKIVQYSFVEDRTII